jgi:pimeloyl-ACP methyl ester carboxylesterase/DNA-binding CsgD family transcriptional regulator
MLHPPQIRFCRSHDGTRIAYEICGAGPPLVWAQHWVHHLKFDWDSPIWRPWLDALARRHTLIRFDWRGCGLSDREGIDFSFEKFVDDLDAVIDAAECEHFALFGMAGAGSGIAIACAVRDPNRVGHLVLCGSHPHGRLACHPTPAAVEESNARLKVFELGWPNDVPAYGQFFTTMHMPDADAAQFRSYNDLLRQATSPANAAAMLRTFWTVDLTEIVSRVRCPTLVLHSRQDFVIAFDLGRSVASLVPNARFVPLESRNHVLLNTEPAWKQMIDAVEEFLPADPKAGQKSFVEDLTARERDVLEIIAQGLDNGAIAARLRISEKTVRNHVSIIFSKLGVNSRAHAVVVARDAGFGHRTS